MELLRRDVRSALSCGEGIKVLLLDDFTKNALSPIVSHAELLSCDFFLFEPISRERCSISVACVAILTKKSFPYLVCEIKSPKYKEYFVFITDELSQEEIASLAAQDSRGAIKELHELYLSAVLVDKSLFLLQHPSGCEKIRALLCALKGFGACPNVRYLFGSDVSYQIASLISDAFSDEPFSNADLLVLDRTFDMLTPLCYPWTYQAMCAEYLSCSDSAVAWGPHRFYMTDEDPFFESTRFMDVVSATDFLSASLKEVRASHDISGEFVAAIRQRAKNSEKHVIHLKALAEISKACVVNDAPSDLISEIILDGSVSVECVLSEEYTNEQKLRAALVSYLSLAVVPPASFSGIVWREEKQISLIKNAFQKEIGAFNRIYMNGKCERKRPTFKKSLPLKLGYVPPVSRIVDKMKTGSLSASSYPYTRNKPGDRKTLIIYVANGITLVEHMAISELFARKYPKEECIIISDQIITGKDVIRSVIG